MNVDHFVAVVDSLAHLLSVMVWPAVAVFLLVRFSGPLNGFLSSLGELSFKGGGIEATVRRQQIEAAASLGVAAGSRATQANDPATPRPDEIAESVSRSVTRESVRGAAGSRVLWVDDHPDNNIHERRALESLGARVTTLTSTDDALAALAGGGYDLVISDMGRSPDPRAGYTLLDALRRRGDRTPFVVYAGSATDEQRKEAAEHGAFGTTNRADELLALALRAMRRRLG